MEPEANQDGHTPGRRCVVALGALTALGTSAQLAACGSGSGSADTGAGTPSPGTRLVALADVPVGGAVAAREAAVVVARPTTGAVVAHTSVCTHAGCAVVPSGGARLACPCHGSEFDALTGAVLKGPAKTPLAAVPVKVSGQDVVAG